MATTELPAAGAAYDDDLDYRALSTGAVAAAVLGVLSWLIFLAARNSLSSAMALTPLPLIAIAVGMRAWLQIRANADSLGGARFALTGVVLGVIALAGGLGYAGYVHATEVREGYTRTSFFEFAPDQKDELAGLFIPKDIQQLDGEKVFIKGYMRPDSVSVSRGVKDFLLVRDNNQCCFGDQSKVKYYDQVAVELVGKNRTDFSRGLFRVQGTLHVFPHNLGRGPTKPVFTIDADYVD